MPPGTKKASMKIKNKTKQETESTAYMYLPGESFPQSKVPEKRDFLQTCPQHRLSVPLCQTDKSTITSFCHMQYSIRGEDVVLRASFTGMDHSQVIGSKNKEKISLCIHSLIVCAQGELIYRIRTSTVVWN